MNIKIKEDKKISVADKQYEESVVVSSKGEIFSWDIKSEKIRVEDLKQFPLEEVKFLIVAKGEKVKNIDFSAQNFLKEKGIFLFVDDLKQGVKAFNFLSRSEKVLAAFDLS